MEKEGSGRVLQLIIALDIPEAEVEGFRAALRARVKSDLDTSVTDNDIEWGGEPIPISPRWFNHIWFNPEIVAVATTCEGEDGKRELDFDLAIANPRLAGHTSRLLHDAADALSVAHRDGFAALEDPSVLQLDRVHVARGRKPPVPHDPGS